MNEISFAHAWVLALLPLSALLLAAWIVLGRQAARRAAALSRTRAGGPRVVAACCIALAVAAAVTAAAQPRWGTRQSLVPRTGAQVIVVLDVSRSMDGTDVAPSRLTAAKTAINATIGRLGGDRIGLVIFAGSARLRIPLTTDFTAASQVVTSLETGSVIVTGGSSAADGLDIALGAFDQESKSGRLMILITDGDDLGTDPAGTAERVRGSGVELLVVGAGTAAGSTVPVYDEQAKRTIDKPDASGAAIVTRLNEPFLRAIAAASGGRYLGSDLRALPGAVEGRIATLDRARFDQQAAKLPVERFQWFAGAALVLLAIGWLAERMPRGAARGVLVSVASLVALLLAGCATEAHDLNEQGRAALARGDSQAAIDAFVAAQQQQPDDPRISLNLASALHTAGRYDDANLAARRALVSRDPVIRGRAEASIGHHRFALQDLPGALDAFRQALVENPNDDASRHDYEVVLRLLQPPPPEAPASGQPGDEPGGPTPGEPGGTAAAGAGSGSATPPAGATPPPGATPGAQPGSQPGQSDPNSPGSAAGPSSPAEADQRVRQLDMAISRLVREAGDTPTPSQALEILRLLAERDRIAASRDGLAGGGDPRDY